MRVGSGFDFILGGFLRGCLGAIGDEEAWDEPMLIVESSLILASCEVLQKFEEFRIDDKDKEIKKPYLTSLIMLQTTLAHELFCYITISLTDTYLPYFIFLSQSQSQSQNYFISLVHTVYS